MTVDDNTFTGAAFLSSAVNEQGYEGTLTGLQRRTSRR